MLIEKNMEVDKTENSMKNTQNGNHHHGNVIHTGDLGNGKENGVSAAFPGRGPVNGNGPSFHYVQQGNGNFIQNGMNGNVNLENPQMQQILTQNMGPGQGMQRGSKVENSFDLSLDEFNMNNASALNLPLFSSMRSVKSQNNGVTGLLKSEMKVNGENGLAMQFEDSCSIGNLTGLSNRQMDFQEMARMVQTGNQQIQNGGLQRVLSNNEIPVSFINEQDDKDIVVDPNGDYKPTNKRKFDLGLNLLSSRRTYSFQPFSSIRSQSKSLLSKVPNIFKSNKKKTKLQNSSSQSSKDGGKSDSSVGNGGATNTEGGKHYSRIENIVLVGEIYTQLFINPALKKQTWQVIAKNFEHFFDAYPAHQPSCIRTSGALERHFKVLKEQNRKVGGTMFAELYEEYRMYKKKIEAQGMR